MNIIFGPLVDNIPDSYTVLELDTIRLPNSQEPVPFYCVVEKIALTDFATLEHWKKIHADVISLYKQQQWNYCEQAIEALMGKWNGELDTFYQNLLDRVKQYKENPPPQDWDGIIDKNPALS